MEIVRLPKVMRDALWGDDDIAIIDGVALPSPPPERAPMYARRDEAAFVAPERLVFHTRADFRKAALEYLDRLIQNGAPRMVVDLGAVKEIDASGLGILVLLTQRAKRPGLRIHLTNVPPFANELLELTRLGGMFDIEG